MSIGYKLKIYMQMHFSTSAIHCVIFSGVVGCIFLE